MISLTDPLTAEFCFGNGCNVQIGNSSTFKSFQNVMF